MLTGINVRNFIILDIFTGIKICGFINWPYISIQKYIVRLYKSLQIYADCKIFKHYLYNYRRLAISLWEYLNYIA